MVWTVPHVGTKMKDSPKIGRFPSHHCRNDPHYRIRSYNGSLESLVIELRRNTAFGHVLQTYAHATPTQSLENHIYTILAPFWEPIWCSKCSENFFLQPTHFEIPNYESYAYAIYKTPSKTGMGIILKANFSKNRNFEQNYILSENFRLIRRHGGVLRLRKVFP